jgi:O-acetyl-ADP-ribose deacetylase (regulator of RNase III)
MIHEIDANLLEFEPIDGIAHSANCFCIMGGGIAAQIRKQFPEAYVVDCETKAGDRSKLGTFSAVYSERASRWIYNVYGQFDLGLGHRHTSYDALEEGLRRVRTHAEQNGIKALGVPRYMGCKLGGGDWIVVRAIIESVFADAPFDLYICNYGN